MHSGYKDKRKENTLVEEESKPTSLFQRKISFLSSQNMEFLNMESGLSCRGWKNKWQGMKYLSAKIMEFIEFDYNMIYFNNKN